MGRSSDEPVAVAAVGLGRWSDILATQYTQLDAIDLVACYTRTESKRASFAAEFDCEAEDSLEAVLDRDDVEALVITVPNEIHADVVERGADAGKHCFVEKPISVTIPDAKRIRDAVERNDITFACGHSCRRLGGIRKMKELIEDGEVGEPALIEAEWTNERAVDLTPDNWRADPDRAPAGPLIQLGIHQIDNFQYLFGPIEQVFSYGKRTADGIENLTLTQTVLEFEDGKQAYLGANWTSPGVFYTYVYGSDSVLFYDLDFGYWSDSDVADQHSTLRKREFSEWSEDKDKRRLRTVDVDVPQRNHLRDQFAEFAEAIRHDDVEPEVGVEEAMQALAVVLAGQKSAREGVPVRVEDVIENR